jgi:hypothetical protein
MSFEGETADKKPIYIYSIVILDAEGNECPLNAGGFDTVFRLLLIGVAFAKGLDFKLEFPEYAEAKSLGGLYTYEIKG